MLSNIKNQRGNPILLSVVSAFHDQLPYNQIFWDMLQRYTYYPFELIAVDNASHDKSGDFYRSVGAMVITQQRNCNYSEAMNVGTEQAKGQYICHINNDVIVSPNWDRILIEAMEDNNLDFACPSSMEQMPTYTESKRALKKWRKIGKPDIAATQEDILNTWWKMYPSWETFCHEHEEKNRGIMLDAINGHTVMMRKTAWEKIGGYDDRMLATDWDLYLTTKDREVRQNDLRAPKIVTWAYVHHFMGITARVTHCAYNSKNETFTAITEKWPMDVLMRYWPFPMHLTPTPSLSTDPIAYVRYAFKRLFNLYQWGDNW
jgi:glycosyltransferase involved in cell wall biosynthesis